MRIIMSTFKLPRTGDRPLQFDGEQIAHTDSRQSQGSCQNRWYEQTKEAAKEKDKWE
jgi:hypothetical protein